MTQQPTINSLIGRRGLMQPYVITCNNCKMEFRTENLTPYTMAVRKYFCPACGNDDVINRSDYRNDRWRSLARAHGLPDRESSVKLLKELYMAWQPEEDEWFKDFVGAVLAEYQATKNA